MNTLDDDDVAGGGAASVLAQAMVREGLRNVAAGANPMALKYGTEKAVEAVTAKLMGTAREVETKEQIAATAGVSAGGSSIGVLVAEAMDTVGRGLRPTQVVGRVRAVSQTSVGRMWNGPPNVGLTKWAGFRWWSHHLPNHRLVGPHVYVRGG